MNNKYAGLSGECKACTWLQTHPKMENYKTWGYYCTKYPLRQGEDCPRFVAGENCLSDYEAEVI